jgi:pSer/pThr/pTyr-binding forkhead associated (FHA) protein
MAEPERSVAAWAIDGEGILIGRESGDITFPDDGYVSGRHCRVFGDDNGVYLEDLDSSNGTYIRVRTGQVVPFGTTLLVGQQLFRIEKP